MKHVLFLSIIFAYSSLAQTLTGRTGSVFETYKTDLFGQTNSTIFKKPFQEYNYVKKSDRIEVYRTYKQTNYNSFTTRNFSTIFSKSEPDFIIKDNGEIYRTYKTKEYESTGDRSQSSIFAKPMPIGIIVKDKEYNYSNQINKNKYESKGLSYDPSIHDQPVGEE